ncbi:MAG: hypothetical protein ACM3PY_11515 [Omnitrophica WOR_2 bacterium]
MITTLFSIFLILHGFVHMLYAGQSGRLFELNAGMLWPDGSWLFSHLLGEGATRMLASVLLVLAALGFMGGGLALLLRHAVWHPVIVGATLFSATIFLLFWDGKFLALDEQGGVGLLISLAIVMTVLILKWPR